MVEVTWLFPPAEGGGYPNISQYRFYKKMPIRASIIYPYLAASGVTLLKDSGYDVNFVDAPTFGITWIPINKLLANSNYVILEGRTPTIKQTWELCQKLKHHFPGIIIIVYGDHVTWNPEETLPYCDYIISGGNYDWGVKCLIDQHSFGNNVSRIYTPPPVNLNGLPFVNRDVVPWQAYYEAWKHRDVFLWNMSMRGCSYHCIFCAWAKTFWNNQIQYRDVGNVLNEYLYLHEKYGDCEILDDADLFKMDWGQKLAEALLQKGYNNQEIMWAVQTHPNEIYDLEALKLMKESGLSVVKLGIESLNRTSLAYMQKGTTVAIIEKAFDLLKQAEIMIHANLIVGWAWETKKDAQHTIDLIKKLEPNQAQFSLLIPYPNTELYRLALKNNWLEVQPGAWEQFDASKPMLKMRGLTAEDVVQLYKDHWKQFYFDPKYIWNHIKKVRHVEGVKQLYRGFKSIYFGHMKAVET